MTNTYTYKGYQAKFEVESEDEALSVSVEPIWDLWINSIN